MEDGFGRSIASRIDEIVDDGQAGSCFPRCFLTGFRAGCKADHGIAWGRFATFIG